ncbi:hypothetical protein L0F63_001373 [Massospora cicadina]|nr:hypothetical protein L0F63_001373 [Massospora cicadina]
MSTRKAEAHVVSGSVRPNPKSSNRAPASRRGRADTLPPSFFLYLPISAPPGLKPSPSNSDLKSVSNSSIPTPKSISALARGPGVLRHRGATFSVPTSLSAPFGQPSPFSPFYTSVPHLAPKPGVVGGDESDQALARSLGYLGLDDPEPSASEQSRVWNREVTIAALKSLGRNRSRSFNAAVTYNPDLRSASPTAAPSPVAVAPPRMSLRQARARAISDDGSDEGPRLPSAQDTAGDDYDPEQAVPPPRHPGPSARPVLPLRAHRIPPGAPEKECAFINFQGLDDAIRAKDDMQGADPTYAAAGAEMQASQPTRALWIGNISASTSSAILQSIFSNFGTVESARVLVHKNCGFVNFASVEEAQRARTSMNGKEISGSVVRIGYAKVRLTGRGGAEADPAHRPHPLNLLGIPVNASEPSAAPEVEAPQPRPEGDSYGVYENDQLLSINGDLVAFPYKPSIPPLPAPHPNRKIDQSVLRERRRALDAHPSPMRSMKFLRSCTTLPSIYYIGNTVIQKLMEKGSDLHKRKLIEKVAPHMASIGCHKNGTWAVQKMIDCAHTPDQIQPIVEFLKPYTPPLLLDQFGNYVIQCCLRFGQAVNQFIFEAIHARFWDVVHGRFGTRAIRTCLDSKYTTKEQQKLVAVALVHHGLFLATDANGSILLTWLLDSSTISGRYRSLVPQFAAHLPVLGTHKLASLAILKIINQRVEPEARERLIDSLFFSDESVLEAVLSDQAYGLGLVQKILVSSCIGDELKERIARRVRATLSRLQLASVQPYRTLAEDLLFPPHS